MRLVYLLLLTLLFPTAVFAQPYRTVSYDFCENSRKEQWEAE